MHAVDVGEVQWQEYLQPREGRVDLKVLLAAEATPGSNFTLALTRYGRGADAFRTPRHRHTFSQLRYATQGSSNYAKGKDIPQGWVAFFPEGAYYGPQHVDGGEILLLQYGPGYLTEQQKRDAQHELAESGKFHDGVYSTVDPDSGRRYNRDAVEALWEHIHGEKLVYPTPAYPEPLLFDPDAHKWAMTSEGVEVKRMGPFGPDAEVIEMVRLSGEAAFEVPPDRAVLIFADQGAFAIDGEAYKDGLAAFSPLGEASAVVGSGQFLLFGFPVS
jgi:hypothetical protein